MTSSVVIKIDSHSNSFTVWMFIYHWFPKYEINQPVANVKQDKHNGEQKARHSVYIPGFLPVLRWREREPFFLTGGTLCLWWMLKDKTTDMFYWFYMPWMLKSKKELEVLFKPSIKYKLCKTVFIHVWPQHHKYYNLISTLAVLSLINKISYLRVLTFFLKPWPQMLVLFDKIEVRYTETC